LKFLIDTNAFIYLFKNQGMVRTNFARHEDWQIKLCAPVYWELRVGALKSNAAEAQLAKLNQVATRFEMLKFDQPAADAASTIRAQLEKLGAPIGPIDTMIAGIAIANQFTLVTRNQREFSRVPDLLLADWYG
jgi:tRNA(fMet)-specific endonuclease VapC